MAVNLNDSNYISEGILLEIQTSLPKKNSVKASDLDFEALFAPSEIISCAIFKEIESNQENGALSPKDLQAKCKRLRAK